MSKREGSKLNATEIGMLVSEHFKGTGTDMMDAPRWIGFVRAIESRSAQAADVSTPCRNCGLGCTPSECVYQAAAPVSGQDASVERFTIPHITSRGSEFYLASDIDSSAPSDTALMDWLDQHGHVRFTFDNAEISFEVPDALEGTNTVRELVKAAMSLPGEPV